MAARRAALRKSGQWKRTSGAERRRIQSELALQNVGKRSWDGIVEEFWAQLDSGAGSKRHAETVMPAAVTAKAGAEAATA